MTSGKFQSYPIDKIFVSPERQRKSLTDIKSLADSIAKIGLIHPPVITREGELKVGERRFTAVKSLGWTSMPVQFVEDLDETELQFLELEENIRRVDLTWQEQCLAVEKYHNLKSVSEPNWTATKTAEMLGSSDSDIHKRRMVAKELHNPVVNNNINYSTALGIVTRNNERKKTSILEKLEVIESGEEKIKAKAPLLNVDFTEWSKTYSGPKFNFIHCDFPYGINSNNHDQGGAKSFGGYEDSPVTYWKLIYALTSAMNNVVAESAHLMFWFSMEFYTETLYALNEMGWKVNQFPLYWHKSDNLGILSDPSRSPRRVVETCLFASRGDRLIVRSISNHVSHPTTKTIHMSEKPIGMLTKLMEMFVDEHSTVLDPTCGSANAIHAAINRGAKTTLGLEINPEFYNKAKETF